MYTNTCKCIQMLSAFIKYEFPNKGPVKQAVKHLVQVSM